MLSLWENEIKSLPFQKDIRINFTAAETLKKIIIIAGPNGAGKTTFARDFLPQEAYLLMFAQGFNLVGTECMNRCQASFVKLTHCLFLDSPAVYYSTSKS